MTDPLAGLLQSLQLAGLDIDAEAALDSVWLGLRMREKAVAGATAAAGAAADSLPTASESGDVPADGTRRESADGGRQRDTLTSRTTQYAAGTTVANAATASAPTLTLARASALPESRDLVKALRPLRRRVVSPGTGVLDVETTVRRAAEEDLWIPSFAAARERWLDVLLVADHGLSMIIWQDTIDEFERVLRNSGAFRSVRSWWLQSDSDALEIAPRGRAPRPATPEQLTRLVRGQARSVILTLSDCVGPRWHDGSVPKLIADWSTYLPVALIQVTPEWFWARTALGDTVGSRFRSPVPATVNRRLRWDTAALGAGGVTPEVEPTLLRVPTTTLTAASVSRVAGLLAGVGREWAPGVVFDLTWAGDEEAPPALAADAHERVARFRTLASKAAQRLAAGYAASPVRTLGVLRLLRRDLLPDASPFTEAEVLLGGVLRVRREEARWDLGAALPLEFCPGVQPLLLDGAVAGDVVRVLTHAARVAASGVGPTFTSWLANPSSGVAQLDPSESAFAASAAEVLARLGGAYARIVKPHAVTTEDTAPSPAAQSQTAPQNQQPDVNFVAEGVFIGHPHQVPLPQMLRGRDPLVSRILGWHQEEFAQRPMVLLGEQGIGKSAIVGHVLRDWRERWPREEAFVWCFQRDPTTHEAFQALRDRYVDPRTQAAGMTRAVLDGLRGRMRSLVVFDGIDGIQDSTELQQLIYTADLIAEITSARVLFTARQKPEASSPMEVVEVGPLSRDDFGQLIADATGAAEEGPQEPGATGTIPILYDLSHGNPLVALTLLPKADSLSPLIMLEELGQDSRSRPIAPSQLDATMELLDRAARARALLETGRERFNAGVLEDAFRAFDEAIRIRGPLPSRRLLADAQMERGRVSLWQRQYDRASEDLAAAVEIYGAVSAHEELVRAQQLLADVRMATGRSDEAIELLANALSASRRREDQRGTLGVLRQLGTVHTQRLELQEALAFVRQAVAVAEQIKDPYLSGTTHLQAAQLLAQMNDRMTALEAAHEAAESFRSVDDTEGIAKAVELIRQLKTPPGDVDRVQSVEYLLNGRVAGVGFRYFVQQAVREIGIQGEATNLPDGRVRVEATGPRSRLDQLEIRLRQGPANAKVDRLEIRILDDGAADTRTRGPATQSAGPGDPSPTLRPSEQRAVIAIGIRQTGSLPTLTETIDAAHHIAEWATTSQGIPKDRVTLITDETGPVTLAAISNAVRSMIDLKLLTQLVFYFAGYSTRVPRDVMWLLTGAPDDPSAALGVTGCVALARNCGIPHVVFISDTCHVSAAAVSATTVIGSSAFPNAPTTAHSATIDQLHAERIDGAAAHDASNVTEAAARYRATYTRLLLTAVNGHDRSLLEERDNLKFLRPRTLGAYLARTAPLLSASVGAKQEPETRIESGPDAWLAVFD